MFKNLKAKYIGDRDFIRMVFGIAVPMILQNAITNFVGLLDNIMVHRLGNEQMSGIAIDNQLMLVFNLAIFGALSGAGIFTAQYVGCKDDKGVRNTFRFKWYIGVVILAIGYAVLILGGEGLIRTYLQGEGTQEAIEATLLFGKKYLQVILWGLPPFVIEQIYSSTLRESGETVVPMKAGVTAVFVNLVLNYLLIFGKFGFPELGVVGAAIATNISRYVQCIIVMVWTHKNSDRMRFIQGAYSSIKIPGNLVSKIIIKGSPLMINEILWSAGIATLTQCYSIRSLDVIAGMNISSTISNLFNVVFISLGSCISIIVGQLLGAGRMEEAVDTDRKMITLTTLSCFVMGGILALLAPLFPQMYNTTDEVRHLATVFLRTAALCSPLSGFMHSTYFTMRTGGKTIVTFLFDSVFLWVVSVPAAYVLSRFTAMPIAQLYLTILLLDLIKCVIGFILVKKRVWVNNIVAE